MLVLKLLKLLRKQDLDVLDVLEFLLEVAKLTKTTVDDKVLQRLQEIYEKDPELFNRLIALILSLILSEAKGGSTCCAETTLEELVEAKPVEEKKETVVKAPEQKSQQPVAKKAEPEKKEEPAKKVEVEKKDVKTAEDVEQILKSLFQ